MSLVSPWRAMMKQTVSISHRTGYSEQGAPAYGSATPYAARVVGRKRTVRTADGEEVTSNQTVYLASNVVVAPDAKITLSTADVGSTEDTALSPPILATGRYPDERGTVYTAVYL